MNQLNKKCNCIRMVELETMSSKFEVCPELEYVHQGSPGSLGSPNTFIEYI